MDLRICFCSNFLGSILNSNKKDEKAMTVIDVSGCGSGAVFLIKGKANLLFEAGMAYAADQMVENIKRELQVQNGGHRIFRWHQQSLADHAQLHELGIRTSCCMPN